MAKKVLFEICTSTNGLVVMNIYEDEPFHFEWTKDDAREKLQS